MEAKINLLKLHFGIKDDKSAAFSFCFRGLCETLSVVDFLPYVMLGELDLDGFGVSSSLPLLVEQLLGVAHPGQKLVQCVLELAQCQKASLQFVLD